MIHGLPNTTVNYIPCFLTGYNVIPIFVDEKQEFTKAEARAIIRKFMPDYPEGTRFVLKRIEVQYLGWYEENELGSA